MRLRSVQKLRKRSPQSVVQFLQTPARMRNTRRRDPFPAEKLIRTAPTLFHSIAKQHNSISWH